MELKENHQDTVNGSEASDSEMWYTTRGKMEMKLIRFSSYSQHGDKKNLQRFLCVFQIRKKRIGNFMVFFTFCLVCNTSKILKAGKFISSQHSHSPPSIAFGTWIKWKIKLFTQHCSNTIHNNTAIIHSSNYSGYLLSTVCLFHVFLLSWILNSSSFSCSESSKKNSRRRHFQWLFRELPPGFLRPLAAM